MVRLKSLTLAMAVVVLAGAALPPAAQAASSKQQKTVQAVEAVTTPSAIISDFYAQLTGVMKDGDKLGFNGRYKKLEPAIRAAFNLPMMTRFSVGSGWASATPEQQQQLIAAFSDFSIATYASRFAKYDGEKFEVVGEKPMTGGVMVETKLTPKGSDAVKLNYLMKPDEKGVYRIVDVFLDGAISELATRRSEFGSIVNREGVPALVNTLTTKSKQMGPS